MINKYIWNGLDVKKTMPLTARIGIIH